MRTCSVLVYACITHSQSYFLFRSRMRSVHVYPNHEDKIGSARCGWNQETAEVIATITCHANDDGMRESILSVTRATPEGYSGPRTRDRKAADGKTSKQHGRTLCRS